ncbi:hypothetical protein B0T26DRAFT_675313 [Lasiosphaeria miniovina]|uniref:Uncharacterized protein n=1 Tax=Lasiosphaeria miniovina TaxID=1954250 RepID=A0AA40AJH1_9PEZI|nr:uncharacterized protein B0T26DRAFT_675313 [Lasiosphaeria miniovina]KAK0716905.1 hypothetical protein B0T26DRAFT_675313 [Lasiosphaeria miniovina]
MGGPHVEIFTGLKTAKSRCFKPSTSSLIVTAYAYSTLYMAPEWFRGVQPTQTPKANVWLLFVTIVLTMESKGHMTPSLEPGPTFPEPTAEPQLFAAAPCSSAPQAFVAATAAPSRTANQRATPIQGRNANMPLRLSQLLNHAADAARTEAQMVTKSAK